VVDTEGWDALVLEGMAHTLAARQIHLLEFEYGGTSGPRITPCTPPFGCLPVRVAH
jgi:hypothetical protein